MKLLLENIEVKCLGRCPECIIWRGGVYVVTAILDTWTWRQQWWSSDATRCYHMVATTNAVMEIYQDGRGWILSRIFD